MTILRKDVPLKEALDLLESLLALPPGTYVSDSRRKSPGRITGADAARKVLVVSFGESERAYDALTVEALEVLPADDFRAMAIFDQPRLAALAKDDPALLVQLVLRAYGPRMGLKDLKIRLVGAAMPAEGWSKWWSGARTAIKRCPVIDMSEGTQPDFLLRSRPVTYEDEAKEKYASAKTVEDKLLLVLGRSRRPATSRPSRRRSSGILRPTWRPARRKVRWPRRSPRWPCWPRSGAAPLTPTCPRCPPTCPSALPPSPTFRRSSRPSGKTAWPNWP